MTRATCDTWPVLHCASIGLAVIIVGVFVGVLLTIITTRGS